MRSRLFFLKEKLAARISEVLDETASAPPSSGRWRGVWEMARGLLMRQQAAAEPDSLQQKLAELHTAIFASVDDEVRWDHPATGPPFAHQSIARPGVAATLATLTSEWQALKQAGQSAWRHDARHCLILCQT